MSDEWTQEGPLGVFSQWYVWVGGDHAFVGAWDADEDIGAENALVLPHHAQQLRDFAQALIRAAERLESSTKGGD